jgi:chemotaxis protein CheX
MTTISLAASLDTAAAAALHRDLLGALDARQPLLIDGSGVKRAGQACLQLLASARIAAAAAGVAYALSDPSDPLADMAALAGLDVVLAPLA